MSHPQQPGPTGYGQQPAYPGYGQEPAPAKRRRKWPWIVGGVVILIIVIAAANGGGQDGASTTAQPSVTAASVAPTPPAPAASAAPAPAPAAPEQPAAEAAPQPNNDEVTYEVTGDGVRTANSITYVKDENFGQEQANGAKLPWTKTVAIPDGPFQPLTLLAQSGSGGSGSITCRILRGGKELTSSTSSGPYAVVTCSEN